MDTFSIDNFIDGPRLVELIKNSDQRGSFTEVYNFQLFKSLHPKIPKSFLQSNLIEAKLNALRGFHGARESENHWKIVTCVSGSIIDAYLDIRVSSETFGNIGFTVLNSLELKTVVIPPGFAHAMQSTSELSKVLYLTNKAYKDQKELDINPFEGLPSTFWSQRPILSQRDLNAKSFAILIKNGHLRSR